MREAIPEVCRCTEKAQSFTLSQYNIFFFYQMQPWCAKEDNIQLFLTLKVFVLLLFLGLEFFIEE